MSGPPHDIEAERAVLGSVLLSNESVFLALEVVQADDFYLPSHRAVWRAMVALVTASKPVDLVTLQASLRAAGDLETAGGAAGVAELAEAVPSAANVRHYAELVRSKSTLRRLIEAGSGIVTAAREGGDADQALDLAERAIFSIAAGKARSALVPVADIIREAFSTIEALYGAKRAITGVPTGFEDLDRMTAGLQSSDLIIIAGRPAMGKTALAMNIATHAATCDGRSVAVFSLEMAKEQLVMRMLCSEGRIDFARMRAGFLNESDWPRLAKAAGAISEAQLWIDDGGSASVLEVRAKCRRVAAERGLGMVVVDYLQLMRGSGQSREQEIAEISRGLKALAKELKVPVVALSQLNRSLESRADKRPVLSDLRESGAIEQDADVILFVYRDEVYNPDTEARGEAELIIGKQRNGAIGTVRVRFSGEFTRFDSLA